jgi:hypothetical protein
MKGWCGGEVTEISISNSYETAIMIAPSCFLVLEAFISETIPSAGKMLVVPSR